MLPHGGDPGRDEEEGRPSVPPPGRRRAASSSGEPPVDESSRDPERTPTIGDIQSPGRSRSPSPPASPHASRNLSTWTAGLSEARRPTSRTAFRSKLQRQLTKKHFGKPMFVAGEEQPLLGSQASLEGDEHMRTSALSSVVTSEREAQDIQKNFDYPTARNLTLMQVAMSMGYSAYMMTSWVYVTLRRQDTFPVCSREWPYSLEMRVFCNISVLAFWTFPLLCCILLVVFFYRELLHTRLYYVMLAHRVLLDFSTVGFFQAQPVRWMVAFLLLSMMIYPLGGGMTIRAIKATLPYWIPVLSFSGMIYSYWDLESRLLSLSKFVELNVDWAKRHIAMSYFIRDYVAEDAYWRIWGGSAGHEVFTTGEFIRELVKECESLEKLDNQFDVLAVRSEGQAMLQQWAPDYWVTDFLYTTQIMDDPEEGDTSRQDFRLWFRVYLWYTILISTLLVYFLLATLTTHLYHQGVIADSEFTHWFSIDSLAPRPAEAFLQGARLRLVSLWASARSHVHGRL